MPEVHTAKQGNTRFSLKTQPPAATPSAVAELSVPTPAAVAAFANGAGDSTMKPLPSTFFKLEEQPSGATTTVSMRGQIKQKDVHRTALVKLPPVTSQRLDAAVTGGMAPAIVALIEYALEDLQRKGLSLVVTNHD